MITTIIFMQGFVIVDPNNVSRRAHDVMLASTSFDIPAICLAQLLNTLLPTAQKMQFEEADAKHIHRQRQHKSQLAKTPTQASLLSDQSGAGYMLASKQHTQLTA